MALTAGHAAYAALHENGINKFIRNVYLVRPHYFHYATSLFGGGSRNISLLTPLEVPGLGNVIQYWIDISQPIIDFVPKDASSTLPAPLNLGSNQFSLTAEVLMCIACGLRDQGHGDQGHGDQGHGDQGHGDQGHGDQGHGDQGHGDQGHGERQAPEKLCTRLNIWAVGHPTVKTLSATDKLIGLQIDQIVVKNICDLETIAECIAKDMANALLEHLQQKVSKFVLGAFGLILTAGPKISDDQLKIWGDIV